MTFTPMQDDYLRHAARRAAAAKTAHRHTQALTLLVMLLAASLLAASFMVDSTAAAVFTALLGLGVAVAALIVLSGVAVQVGSLGWRLWGTPCVLLLVSAIRLFML